MRYATCLLLVYAEVKMARNRSVNFKISIMAGKLLPSALPYV